MANLRVLLGRCMASDIHRIGRKGPIDALGLV